MTLAPLSVLGASCALGGFEKVEGGPSDAGVDQGCQHATVPSPPDMDGGVEAGPDQEFTTAMRVLRLKKSATGGPLGLDIDRFCSCQGDKKSCIPPPLQPEDLACDQAEGRDNQAQALFGLLELVLNLDPKTDGLSELYSSFAELGRWSVLIRVSGYNGTANDDKVRVEWYPSGGTGMPPLWNGVEPWPVVPTAFEEVTVPIYDDAGMPTDAGMQVTVPKYVDNDAYVTNELLVFSLPNSVLAASNGQTRLAMNLTDGTVMARIDKQPTGIFLRDGVVAGRMKQEDLFRMVGDFRDHNGMPFCTDNPFWPTTKDAFCRGLDIQTGFAVPNKRCDAVSVGLGFESEPATIGPVEEAMPSAINCDMGLDPVSNVQMFPCP